MSLFKLASDYEPTGDQPQAIADLVESINGGNRDQTLLGVTGSGKTFTMANVIAQCGRPTLIISHNKTLAAQLYSEFKNFFPENAVEYFVHDEFVGIPIGRDRGCFGLLHLWPGVTERLHRVAG